MSMIQRLPQSILAGFAASRLGQRLPIESMFSAVSHRWGRYPNGMITAANRIGSKKLWETRALKLLTR
jgi:hypothetical protein